MASISLCCERSAIVVVDLQPSFLKVIFEADRVVARAKFLLKAARLLNVPVIGTTQNAKRMGGLDAAIEPMVPRLFDKMTFSCCGSEEFNEAIRACGRDQIVVVGIETHICVGLTALDLLRKSFGVVVCPDAVSATSLDRHKLGMERIRDAGVVPVHSEAVVYEWLGSAESSDFREVLELVKRSH